MVPQMPYVADLASGHDLALPRAQVDEHAQGVVGMKTEAARWVQNRTFSTGWLSVADGRKRVGVDVVQCGARKEDLALERLHDRRITTHKRAPSFNGPKCLSTAWSIGPSASSVVGI